MQNYLQTNIMFLMATMTSVLQDIEKQLTYLGYSDRLPLNQPINLGHNLFIKCVSQQGTSGTQFCSVYQIQTIPTEREFLFEVALEPQNDHCHHRTLKLTVTKKEP